MSAVECSWIVRYLGRYDGSGVEVRASSEREAIEKARALEPGARFISASPGFFRSGERIRTTFAGPR